MKKSNRGFTIVELLVVITISAVMMALFTLSLRVVTGANVRKAANSLASAIRTARTQCMAKGVARGELKLSMKNGALYYSIGTGEDDVICNSSITVSTALDRDYSTMNSESMSDGDVFLLRFNASGTLKTAGLGGADGQAGLTQNIFFLSSGTKTYKVVVYIETGKVDVILL